jgi:hypothetical protein
MKYIGIKGTNKRENKIISYLIGYAMESYLTNKSINTLIWNEWDMVSNQMIDEMLDDPMFEGREFQHIYYESFGDTVKLFVRLLLNCDARYVEDAYYKDNYVVNMKNFNILKKQDVEADSIVTSNDLYIEQNKESVTPFKTDKFITIREFIMYYGYEVMQRFFGANVWVKTLNDGYMNFFDGEDNYKIYIDVKTAAEVAYVKDQGGCIVNVIGSKSKKSSLIAESESDFNILYSNSPVDLQESVMNVVKKILECKEDM